MNQVCIYSTAISGIILSGVLLVLKEPVINSVLRFGLVVRPDSFFYNQWIDISDDIEIWIWNITNSDDYTVKVDRFGRVSYTFPVPKVEQVGPFVYRQHYLKKNSSFLNDEGEIVEKHPTLVRIRQTFEYASKYSVDDPKSGLDPETTIVNIPNLIALTFPKIIEYICGGYSKNVDQCSDQLMFILRQFLNQELSASGSMPIVKNVRAGDAIWKYNDPAFIYFKNMCRSVPVCADSGISDILPDGIGMMEIKNSTIDWPFYEMDTGYKKLNETLQIKKFSLRGFENLKDEIDVWPSNTDCSLLRGTDGRSGQPGLDETTDVWVFLADLFRSFKFKYQETKKEPRGFTSSKYAMVESSLASPEKNPENQCFCENTDSQFWKSTNMDCTKTGGGYLIENVFWGFPLLLTNAHYNWGKSWIQDNNNNSSPRVVGDFQENTNGQFDTFVKYEKLSGLPIKGVGRYQFSLAIAKDERYSIYDNMEQDTIIMPLLWANETFELSDWGNLEDLLWWFAVFTYTGYTVLFSGLIICCLIFSSVFYLKNWKE